MLYLDSMPSQGAVQLEDFHAKAKSAAGKFLERLKNMYWMLSLASARHLNYPQTQYKAWRLMYVTFISLEPILKMLDNSGGSFSRKHKLRQKYCHQPKLHSSTHEACQLSSFDMGNG